MKSWEDLGTQANFRCYNIYNGRIMFTTEKEP